jgi:hypothetical protein
MLITCVDLVKSRLGAMDGEARKLFIFILAQLIEKSPVGFTLNVQFYIAKLFFSNQYSFFCWSFVIYAILIDYQRQG